MNEDIKNNEQKLKKRKRKRKLTKAQEEKRVKLLSKVLDRWVFVRQNWSDDETYIFLKHRIPEGGSHSKIEQLLLSGDPLHDGIYLITDYEIDLVYDHKTKKEIVDLKPKKFDLKLGMFAEQEVAETFEELKNKLIGAKYLTEEEFFLYYQNTDCPNSLEEMRLSYVDFDDDKE